MTWPLRRSLGATVFYLVATGAMTWPLLAVIDREVAADMGDPMLNCWIMLWTGGQVLAFLSGDFSALSRFWHGNIFHPEPLTIAYSEHLTAQMMQALPVIASTSNIILAYNLVFIATFVLSGLGMFLFVRDLTGRSAAALVAGMAFAFAPYRFDQLSHIQVLSAQWMPFVLYGFRRHLETGRWVPLAGASLALVAQNLSCGYYALFFTPFAVAYVVYELAARRRLRDWKAWRAFIVAAIAVAVATLPFLTPYLEVRDGGVGVRSLGEIAMFSADIHAFATAPLNSWLWGGRISAFHSAEGQAFPGFTILLLAVLGASSSFIGRRRALPEPLAPWRQILTGLMSVLLAAYLYALGSVVVVGRFTLPTSDGWMVWRYVGQAVVTATALVIGLILLRWRSATDKNRSSTLPWAFFTVATLAAAVLAMGPQISVKGIVVASGPYAWLMDYIPGFDGLRVPGRYVMLVTLFLGVLAGLGASFIQARAGRFGAGLVLAAGTLILLESRPAAFETNRRQATEGFELTPRDLQVGRRLPPIYKTIRDNPEPVVLLEFPFGNHAWDLHAVFYAGYHRQRLVNGYSGFFPESNQYLVHMLNMRIRDPQGAWRALLGSGATHVLVHEGAFPEPRRKEVTDWLVQAGAREILMDDTDRLFAVR